MAEHLLTTNPWNFTGNPWAVDLLRHHTATGTTRHAYLITGPRGVGRRTLATRFIRAQACQKPPTPGEFCVGTANLCRACRLIEEYHHPDLMVIRIDEGASEIKIDQIREIQSFIALRAYELSIRAVLILNAQTATHQAQNALLKTLEEAPEQIKLILTADQPENLLATITSRCELIRLRPLPRGAVEEVLVQEGVEAETAALADAISGGCIGAARSLTAGNDFLDNRTHWLDDWNACLAASLRERYRTAEQYGTSAKGFTHARSLLRSVLPVWLSYSRDLLCVAGGKEDDLQNPDRIGEYQQWKGKISPEYAVHLIKALETTIERVDRYMIPRLALEGLMLAVG